MSKGQTLRDLVMERLVVAADEIFALFERTIAEYEEEVLRSKLSLETHNKGVQTPVILEAGSCPEHIKEEQTLCIKQEEEPPLEFPLTSVSVDTEDNVEKSLLLQQEPPEESREEPGCSLYLQSDKDKQTYSCSDTDNSDDWEPSAKRSTTCDGQEPKTVHKKDSKRGRAEQNIKYDGERKPKPYKCSLCYRTFECEANLQKHTLNHSRQRSFTCAVCNKAFSLKSSYKKHLVTHRDEKPFSCSFCNRGFTQKCHLKEHMRIHTGERPYSCTECGIRFRQQNSMLRHILSVHKREKPYRCPVCERAFVQKHYFFEHMRTHTGEKPYSCSVCNKGFSAKGTLKKHLSGVHRVNAVAQNEVQE